MRKHVKTKLLMLSLLLLLGCYIEASAQGQMITINLKNASLKQVFNAIEKQTTYRFSYRNAIIDNRKDVTLSMKRVSVTVVLDDILKNRNLEYAIVSPKSIVI